MGGEREKYRGAFSVKKEEGFGTEMEERCEVVHNIGTRLLRAVAKESGDDRGRKRRMFGREDTPEMLECGAANKSVGCRRA